MCYQTPPDFTGTTARLAIIGVITTQLDTLFCANAICKIKRSDGKIKR